MNPNSIPRVATRFSEFRASSGHSGKRNGKLLFAGVGDKDVYNITAPFASAGREVIAGRVEDRDREDSTAIFFERREDAWYPIEGAPRFRLQDPFIARVGDELTFGGVQIRETDTGLSWHTVLYRGPDIYSLKEFFAGPEGMKDIRLCDRRNGRIGIFTRPQGARGGRGTIGYTEVSRLEDLTVDALASAPLLEGMFHPLDWGGANEAHLLEDGRIGVLAHAACFQDDNPGQSRHYYAAAFRFDPNENTYSDFRIIASRDQFAQGPAKRPDLVDVVFPSGLVQREGKTRLYAGISDAGAQWLEISEPFP